MSNLLISGAYGLAFVAGATAIVLASYFLARRLLPEGTESDRTHDVAGSVAFRIAALHGLILGLVYAQELSDYKDVRSALTEEAIAVTDVYNDIRRYGGGEVDPVQDGLKRYLSTVIDVEWGMLGRSEGLSPQAWAEWEGVYERLLNLQPTTNRERWLGDRMLGRITDVAKLREAREAGVFGRFSGLFWAPAIAGLALLSVPFHVYRPTRGHLVLLSTFGIYSGVVLFFIYAFSDPFRPPGRLEPVAFERLLRGDLDGRVPSQ